jgi:transcriptional regulator with XRE-family HTH domain
MSDHAEVQRFGEKLRALRMGHGMTVRELATALGYVGHSYVNGVELGRNKPTPELIVRVALLFGVTTDQLLRDDLELDEMG